MAPLPDFLGSPTPDVEDWVTEVDDVSAKIRGIIDGSITDFEKFDRDMELKQRAKQIRDEEVKEKRERFYRMGTEGKGEGKNYKWWCRRCFVEYSIDLPGNCCSRCGKADKMMTRDQRREELLGKVEDMKQEKVRHQWRKDKWLRWKKSQALLRRSRNINYKAWEYWEPDTDSEDEGEPVVPRENPEFQAMEADLISRRKKTAERAKAAKKCQERGNAFMKDGDYISAIETYDEGLENNRSNKALWTNKALAEIKVFRYHDAVESCNKVIEYAEIFEEGFQRSADACFKAFMRRALALSALHKWEEALKDVEDALHLFPKDREAKELHKKTLAAVEEAREADALRKKEIVEIPAETAPIVEQAAAEEPAVPSSEEAELRSADGPEGLAATYKGSMGKLSLQDFASLTERLRKSHSDRVAFCAHGDANEGVVKRGDDALVGRKVCLKKVEEVSDPSALDGVLKDMERCCILWKKAQGRVVPLREDVRRVESEMTEAQRKAADAEAAEEAETAKFLEVVTPRALEVLLILARASDLHCEFTSAAVRQVWPFLSDAKHRYTVLELLSEWSQRPFSAKAMVEFASRYPDPHLSLLVDAMAQENKENMLPPNFESLAKEAHDQIQAGKGDLDAALSQVMDGLSTPSATELAVTTLGNICVAGASTKAFKEQMLPHCEEVVEALKRLLKPQHPRLCGRAAGAVCNVVRLGESFAAQVQEKCTKPLVSAVREEPATKLQSHVIFKDLPWFPQEGCMSQLLGAWVNLLAVRPAAAGEAVANGLLDLVVKLISDQASDTAEVATRALLIVGRLVAADPTALSTTLESQLLQALNRIMAAQDRSTVQSGDLTSLDAAVRILTLILTKSPGALARLAGERPRVEEVVEGSDLSAGSASADFEQLLETSMRLASLIQPKEHVKPEDEGAIISKVRGNLALLFAGICEAQAKDNAPPVLRDLNLSGIVEVFVECLRKERGGARHNAGVCVTRLAQQQRYRQRVRDLNGIESLHQIQMPQVEKQKAEAMKQHRKNYIAGSE